MRLRVVAAAAVCAALTLGVSAASAMPARLASPSAAQATTLRVWLQVDAQQNWEGAVNAASNKFEASHSGVDVKVEYQTWNDHLTKFDASLAGSNAPDVIELGNTEMTKYMAAGAFADITSSKRSIPNSSTWLKGLTDSATYNGKLYGVPYYAGARAVIYRTDQYKAAGIKGTPKSLAQFIADGRKLMKKYGKDGGYSAVYFPGKYWYFALSFVYDYGGQVAVRQGGKWKGTLNTPRALAGLNQVKTVLKQLSRASKTGDEANPQQSLVFAKGKVGSFIGNGWEWPYALDEKLGNPGLASSINAYPMPSHIKGRFMPTFLGGSDLAIPVTTKNQGLAADWIKAFTSTAAESEIAKAGNIANTTKLLSFNASNPKLAPFARAAKYSWFVPTSPNWVNVENANVLQNMLVKIATGRASVRAAATSASSQITRILNTGA
ncbi:MAG: extracellular solute-binding protein [Gaiellaceae bacterium]